MSNRPAIPMDIQRDLLFECRYRCACDCEPVSLEKAHIIPWAKTKDHSFENLVVLCANCHTRSHVEKWPDSQLKRFKEKPCALERDRLPPVPPDKKALLDFIVSADADSMTEKERARFVLMTAAYVNVTVSSIQVVDVVQANSSLVRLEMPLNAAERLILGFQSQDPKLVSFLDDFAAAQKIIVPIESLTGGASQDLYEEAAMLSLDEAEHNDSFMVNEVTFGGDGSIKLIESARPTLRKKGSNP